MAPVGFISAGNMETLFVGMFAGIWIFGHGFAFFPNDAAVFLIKLLER